MRRPHLLLALGIITTTLSVASCTSTGSKTQTAPPAPPAATPVPAAQPPATPPPTVEPPVAPPVATEPVPQTVSTEQSIATFYRQKRFAGAILNTSVHVDGVELADLDGGTYVKVPLTPGKHAIYCDEAKDTINLDVQPGKEYYFRVELQVGFWKGHGVFKQVDPAEGAAQFKEWKPVFAKDVREPSRVVK